MKAKKNIRTGNFLEAWNFVKQSRNYIYIIIGVFIVSVIMGFVFPAPDFIVEIIREIIKKLAEQTGGLNAIELMVFIFWNNLKLSFLGLSLGIVLGIFPVMMSFFNGYVLGFVSKITMREAGIFSLWRIFPHGIFELPAVFISLGLGIKLGFFIFYSDDRDFLKFIKKSFFAFIFVVLPLLVVAAVIEGALIKIVG
jgi:stage II sporulation protein M